MDREAHQRRLAEILTADMARRAVAEIEIARREARLARESARLAAMRDEAEDLEAELNEARRLAKEGEAGEA